MNYGGKKMVTVEKIMQLDIIQEQLVLISGKKGLHKTINYITIMEAPDFYQWVSGGEFVLTTWYAFSQNPEMQEEAFRELAKKVSCIGIKVDRFLKKIPEKLIQIADEYQTPLFAIKRETKFREIIQAVAAEVQNVQTNILLKVEKHYKELMQAALSTEDFSMILRSTGKHIGKSCFCISPEGKVLGYWTEKSNKETLLKRAEEFYIIYNKREYLDLSFKDKQYNAFFCIAHKHLLGIFVILEENDLSEQEVLMAQQTVSILALKLLEGYAGQQKLLAQLLSEIKQGLVTEDRLDCFGLKWRNKSLYTAVLSGYSRNISNLLGSSVFLENTEKKLAIIDTQEIVFIGAVDRKTENNMPTELKNLVSWLERKKLPLVLAIGSEVKNIVELKDSLEIARTTAAVALRMNSYGYQDSKEWFLQNLLFKHLDTVEIKQIEQHLLQPLQKYDQRYEACLLETLKAVVQSPKSDVAAEKLHIHVNTLRYRLSKIKDITGYDTRNPVQLNLLWLAALIGDLKKDK